MSYEYVDCETSTRPSTAPTPKASLKMDFPRPEPGNSRNVRGSLRGAQRNPDIDSVEASASKAATLRTCSPSMRSSSGTEYLGMVLQPDSWPISEEQLAAEVKGIYDSLVAVETKCIDIDAALASDHQRTPLTVKYQALIRLHRTLLYEHHDFLLATQHPSASKELRSLATKYSMPARMWKHGIHAFLEVLRHRKPESQDYMLAFVVLAYQMTALLFETVPCFTDTWVECLGDLARYRIAIEDEVEARAIWPAAAGLDRDPDIGRMRHHLGILGCLIERSAGLNPGTLAQREQDSTAQSRSRRCRVHGKVLCLQESGSSERGSLPWTGTPRKLNESGRRTTRVQVAADQNTESNGTTAWQSALDDPERARRTPDPAPSSFESLSDLWSSLPRRIRRLPFSSDGRKKLQSVIALLLFSSVTTTTAYPLADPWPGTEQSTHSEFAAWVLPLVAIVAALLRAGWIIQKPLRDIDLSNYWTNYEFVSAAAPLVSQAVAEPYGAGNSTILAAWLFIALGNSATRYRLTAEQFQRRFFPILVTKGLIEAFIVAFVLHLLTGDDSVARGGLRWVPLGLSFSSWSLFRLWRHPGNATVTPLGESQSVGESHDIALEPISNGGARPSLRNLYDRSTVGSENPWLEEQPLRFHTMA